MRVSAFVGKLAVNASLVGYRGLPGRIEVAVDRSGPELVIAIRDEAPPFDPTGYQVRDLSTPLADRTPGGFGIHLTRSCVDRVTHAERRPTGNELTLVRRLDHQDPPTQERHT